ncbi:MAG: trypsin-like serine protease, partial [Myxococcota bacterium]
REQFSTYDIGVLVLSRVLEGVTPLPLYLESMDATRLPKTLYTAGYGRIQTHPENRSTTTKHSTSIPLDRVGEGFFVLYDRNPDPRQRKSACHGDSGGPALVQLQEGVFVVGVTSRAYEAQVHPTGQTYCDGGVIYTRVDHVFADFLAAYLLENTSVDTQASLTCSAQRTCGACGTCVEGRCTSKPWPESSTLCLPCARDQDCVSEYCVMTTVGKRCLPPATAVGCCPSGYHRAPYHAFAFSGQLLCVPNGGQCAAVACSSSEDCGPGEQCKRGTCVWQPPDVNPTHCAPCRRDQDCGPGGVCEDAQGTVLGFCTQECSTEHQCPRFARCVWRISAKRSICVFEKGCFQTCATDAQCKDGNVCKSLRCQSREGVKEGALCSLTVPCARGLRCARAEGQWMGRCFLPCRIPSYSPGSFCARQEHCPKQHTCFYTRAPICVEKCTHRCSTGKCRKMKYDSFCTCLRDADCASTQHCVFAYGGTPAQGLCMDKSHGQCADHQQCTLFDQRAGYLCLPRVSTRQLRGQPCDAFRQCAKGDLCSSIEGVDRVQRCYASCGGQRCAGPGELCLSLDSGIHAYRACVCRQDRDCMQGSFCHKIVA